MRDPYEILGLDRSASGDEIRDAYRKLAKASHPDLHPGDQAAESRFKDISAANAILSDDDKRRRFDSGEIDASGAERPQRDFYRGFAEGPEGDKYRTSEVYGDAEDIEKMFADLFGDSRDGSTRLRGADVAYNLVIDFFAAARGARRQVTMPDGRNLNVTIPVGVRDRQTLRLKGMGAPGLGGAPAGDAYVEIRVRPHPQFERRDDDIRLELPVTLGEAMQGAVVTVPTVAGSVSMTIPERSTSATTLRLKGKGIPARGGAPAGDQYVRLKVVLPTDVDDDLAALVGEWEAAHPYDPRRDLMREAAL